jgi:hypothetical protein
MITKLLQIFLGTPPAANLGDVVPMAGDTTRSGRVHLSQGLDPTSSGVTTEEVPASGGNEATQAISNAAATPLNGGASLPCIWVIVQNRVAQSPIAVGWSTIAGVNEGTILQAGASVTIPVDDVAKVYGWATVLNEQLDWSCGTR